MRLLFTVLVLLISCNVYAQTVIRVNQVGYLPQDIKKAVLLSEEEIELSSFSLYEALTGEKIAEFESVESSGEYGVFASTYRLDFSSIEEEGAYYIKAGGEQSPPVVIAADAYAGAADFLLRYMRQQRCGYNPFLDDSCHTEDGFIIYRPPYDSTHIDVTGGWHDASDYLQYVTTSANATFQLLFAYQQNPEAYGDEFDANGRGGSNGIPDILDEAKWGLDWLVKMNPEEGVMYNQIADDRDHNGFNLPTLDVVDYGKGPGGQRPVYFCTGEPQGVFKHQNRSDGIASTAGKYASAFALGSQLLKEYYPEFSEIIKRKSEEAYKFGLQHPGVCQTAPCKSPYFYEEDNWVEDMQLGAFQVGIVTKKPKYLEDAVEFGRKEKVTPWMGSDTASHYQWYPFINLGHYFIATNGYGKLGKEFTAYLRDGLKRIYLRGKDNPFLIGIPFIWCSNNLVSAAITQCRLYENLSGDDSFLEMETALRDWLFGCNPWGTSMIVGYPAGGDYPEDPHTALTAFYGYRVDGGLVDGPVYATIFNNLIGLVLHAGDEYADYQMSMVYHDDYGDYSTNEPTMDGTASLSYYLSALEKEGLKMRNYKKFTYDNGGIIRTDKSKKEINLVFTGGDFADGYETISGVLKEHNLKASFFFTGDFYRNPEFKELITELKKEGHYLGAHSDQHLQYVAWDKRDSTLVTEDEFKTDILANYIEMKKFGISPKDAPYFLPPYEWYNEEISSWSKQLGLTLVNYTPGTLSAADWTVPELGKSYRSTDEIYESILTFEENEGLNGFILLLHIGAHPDRTDKFYDRFEELIDSLLGRGYTFKLMNETI